MEKSYGGRQCMKKGGGKGMFEFDEDVCKCIDYNYFPAPVDQLNELKTWTDSSSEPAAFASPFYWSPKLGEYTSGDLFDEKFKYYKSQKDSYCKKLSIIEESQFDTLADFSVDKNAEESDADHA